MGLRYFRKEKQYLEMTDFGKMPNYNRVEMFLHDLSFPHFKIGTIVLVLHQKYISGHFRISNSKMKYIVQKNPQRRAST